MSDLRTRLQTEVLVRRMHVSTAFDRLHKEEREAQKEKRPLPKHARDLLAAEIAFAQGNLQSAVAALEAVCKYPPLTRSL